MNLTDQDIRGIIEETIRSLRTKDTHMSGQWLCDTADQAVESAKAAQQQMAQAPAEPAVSTTPAVNADKLAQDMQAATDLDALYEQAALMDAVTDEGARLRLNEVFDAKQAELEAA